MNKIRNLVCILMGLAIAALALPSSATSQFTKQYSLVFTSDASLTVTAHLTNLSRGPGNSNISSFQYVVSGAQITSVDQPAAGTAQLTGNNTVTVTGIIPPIKSGQEFDLTIHLGGCGDSISWSATVWTGTMGQTFAPVAPQTLTTPVSCGDIACGGGQGEGGPIVVPNSLDPGAIEVERGTWDKNGNIAGACSGIPYFVTDNLAVNDQVHFRWLVSGGNSDPAADFQFRVFREGPIPAETEVAWFNTDGSPASSPGTPDFIPGLPCNAYANFLPTPYGTLISDDGSTTLHVNTTVGGVAAVPVSSVPFDVFIENERLTVSAVNDTTLADEVWTVSARNVGGIVGTVPHTAANLLVMSEPLPIMTITQGVVGEYVMNTQAQMCISNQEESDNDADDEVGESSPTDHSTTFIDIGDGYGGHP